MSVQQLCPSERSRSSLPLPTYIDHLAIATSGASSYTVPVGAGYVIISADQAFWMNTTTAVAPSGGVSNGSGVLYVNCPIEFSVNGGEVLSLIGVADGYATIAVYNR